MANPDVTAFVDDAARAALIARAADGNTLGLTPDVLGGMNVGASNAPGIGINQDAGAVVGTPEQFTLLDQGRPVESGEAQVPVAREAQVSQLLGGLGISDPSTSTGAAGALPEAVIRFGPQDAAYPDGSGEITFAGNSTLSVLADGWEIQA